MIGLNVEGYTYVIYQGLAIAGRPVRLLTYINEGRATLRRACGAGDSLTLFLNTRCEGHLIEMTL